MDDVIARGAWTDWIDLRAAALCDRTILEKIARIAVTRANDSYAQRYHFWRNYAEAHLA